jgi:copper chaperone CopZ
MIEPHIHCAECYQAIATKIKCAGGKTKDAELHLMQQPRVAPAPGGKLAVLTVTVPLCQGCAERIEKALRDRERASKLIVPGLGLAPDPRPQ